MNTFGKTPSPKALLLWFNPFHRKMSGWGFLLNRITALGLTFYLYLHLYSLGNLARGEGAYQNFLQSVNNPFYIFGEVLVIAGGFIHGLNGLRIAITSLGIAVPFQKVLFVSLITLAVILTLIFAIHMFTIWAASEL
jgi:succinate dehydrogenase / fumarate reductase cytochrome b subunit